MPIISSLKITIEQIAGGAIGKCPFELFLLREVGHELEGNFFLFRFCFLSEELGEPGLHAEGLFPLFRLDSLG